MSVFNSFFLFSFSFSVPIVIMALLMNTLFYFDCFCHQEFQNIVHKGHWELTPLTLFTLLTPECLIQVASALQSKVFAQPCSGYFPPCILPCKIGGSQNLMKERYLSKTPNVTFVYLSKCNIKLPGIFGNSKKKVFVNRSTVQCTRGV